MGKTIASPQNINHRLLVCRNKADIIGADKENICLEEVIIMTRNCALYSYSYLSLPLNGSRSVLCGKIRRKVPGLA